MLTQVMDSSRLLEFLRVLIFLTTPLLSAQNISIELDSIHNLSGSDKEKIEQYQAILAHHKNNNNLSQLGNDAHQIGKWLYKEKRYSEAISFVTIAYKAREKAKPYNPEHLRRSYFNYAYYNMQLQKYDEAILFFEKVINVKGSKFVQGRSYALLGDCYNILGDHHKAINNYSKAFFYFNKDNDNINSLGNHINIGFSYMNLRNKEGAIKAIDHFKKADSLVLIYNPDNIERKYFISNNLAVMYHQGVGTKDENKSIKNFKKALNYTIKLKDSNEIALVNYNLGVINIKKDSVASKDYFSQALKYGINNTKLLPKIYMGLGIKAIEEKEYLQAQSFFKTSFEKFLNKDIPDIYWVPSKNDSNQVLEKAKFLELLKRKLKAWITLAKQTESIEYYQEAIKTAYASDQLVDLMITENLSRRSKLQWRSLSSQIYIMALEACYQTQNFKDAFYFMEKSKSLLLIQDINKEKINVPTSILEKERRLIQTIVTLKSETESASVNLKDSIAENLLIQENYLKKLRDSLAPLYPGYFTSYSIPPITSLNEVTIPKDEVIIQYNYGQELPDAPPLSYVLLLGHNTKKLVKLNQVDSLEKQIKNFREILNQPFKTKEDIIKFNKTSYQLFQKLFPAALRSEIKGKKLSIIADNIIHSVPFEALVTDTLSNKYFIESNEISYIYSLSFHKKSTTLSRNPSKQFLGIAPVVFNDSLTNLSQSTKELSNAENYYSGNILTYDNAKTHNFITNAGQYKILHLATHASAIDSVSAPWIAFRDKTIKDYELAIIPNQAELVVLSACNTSIGEIRNGEGVLSLARGFFKSGAKTVISTLWNTNDKATAEITKDFYKNLSKGATKSEALHKAKLNYLKNHSGAEASPHYWASLVLIGDTGQLLPKSNYTYYLVGLFIILILLALGYVLYRRREIFTFLY